MYIASLVDELLMHPCTINDSLQTFIDALGGCMDVADINSAAYSEGGKDLLAWLAQQAAFLNECPEESESKQSLDDRIQVILRDVTLEKDEIPLSRNVDTESLHVEKAPDSLNSYMPPSKLMSQAAFIKDENDLIQRQIDALTLRISKMKESSNALVLSIKSLQRVAHTLDAKIRNEEAIVTELSFQVVQTDSTVATTITDAEEAFRSLGYFPAKCEGQPHTEADLSEPNHDLTSIRAFLLAISDKISKITSDVRNALDLFSDLRKGQPEKIRDIETESNRLHAAFHSLDIGDEDAVFEIELRKICLLLGHEVPKSASEVLTTLLSETGSVSSASGWMDHRNLAVQDVLQNAWVRDQMASLQTENAILDWTCTSLASGVEPLHSLRSLILPLVSSTREVEAVVEAFIEELGDIALPEGEDRNQTWDLEDTELEENLRRVLIKNQGIQSPGALPSVLMTREQILVELEEIRNRTRNVEPTERARTEGIVRQAALRPLHSALPHIYVNSPLHSSPPFAFPPVTQDLEASTKKKAGDLQSIADSAEEDFKSTSAKDNNIKRLDAFIEKWIPK